MSNYKSAWNKWKNSPSREIETIKKNQMEILEPKNTVTEIFKKCSGCPLWRNEMTEERIGELGKEQ